MTDENDTTPTLPIIAAETAIQTLDKHNGGPNPTGVYHFAREDLYNMLRDVSRLASQYAWDMGHEATEDEENPFNMSYWEENS
jgi:hypothetical protein